MLILRPIHMELMFSLWVEIKSIYNIVQSNSLLVMKTYCQLFYLGLAEIPHISVLLVTYLHPCLKNL